MEHWLHSKESIFISIPPLAVITLLVSRHDTLTYQPDVYLLQLKINLYVNKSKFNFTHLAIIDNSRSIRNYCNFFFMDRMNNWSNEYLHFLDNM